MTDDDVEHFIRDGFVRIDGAFSPECAAAARAILWRDIGASPDDPRTWTRPVVRLGMYSDAPFREAASSPVLRAAFDRLVGEGRWVTPGALGTFPVRFPSEVDVGDTGWHIDASFGTETPDFLEWRTNVTSRGRALLLLFLFSEIGNDDAPTRIRVGSHRAIARTLAPAGEAGMTLRELIAADWGGTSDAEERLATGPAGTVYLCHPFLVHAAQVHRGTTPRFLAQPPLLPTRPLSIDGGSLNAVERSIRVALDY